MFPTPKSKARDSFLIPGLVCRYNTRREVVVLILINRVSTSCEVIQSDLKKKIQYQFPIFHYYTKLYMQYFMSTHSFEFLGLFVKLSLLNCRLIMLRVTFFFSIETIILVIYFTKNICGFVVTWQIMVTLSHSWIESGTFFTSNMSKSGKKYLIFFMGQT